VARPALAVARVREKSFDLLLVGVRRRVLLEGVDLLRRRRQAVEVEREAAQERAAVRFGRRREPFDLEAGVDEAVDLVPAEAFRDRDGRLIAFAKVTRDMTERVGAQAALRESEERFRILVQGVADYAIYMLDPEGRITNWNLGGERIKGYPADEIVGQHFSIFFTPEDRARG